METSLLCFCMRWGHARIQEFLCQKTALTTFLVLNFTEGAQCYFKQNYICIYIFFFFFWGGVQILISIETHTANDFPGGPDPQPPLDPRMGRLCVCTCPSSEPSLLANATSTRMRLVSRDACNEQMINCNCTHQSSSSQAKGTNSTSFLELVPLACEDDQSFENHRHIWTCS